MKRLIFVAVFSLASSSGLAGTAQQEVEACTKALAAGDYAQALQHASASIGISNTNRDAYLCQARVYTSQNDHANAINALQTVDKLSNLPIEHIVALTLIGNQHLALRAFDQALECYRRSLVIARETGNKHFEMINLNQVGEALEGKTDYKGALENYLPALKLAANENERADCNARIASSYSAIDEHNKAIEHQIKAMFLEETSGDFDHYSNASLELGRIYLHAGQYNDAERTLVRALEKIRKAGDPYWEAKGNYYLAQVKRGQGDSQAAGALLVGAKQQAEKIGASDLVELISAQK